MTEATNRALAFVCLLCVLIRILNNAFTVCYTVKSSDYLAHAHYNACSVYQAACFSRPGNEASLKYRLFETAV